MTDAEWVPAAEHGQVLLALEAAEADLYMAGDERQALDLEVRELRVAFGEVQRTLALLVAQLGGAAQIMYDTIVQFPSVPPPVLKSMADTDGNVRIWLG